jgi:hypothetical protein
MKSQTTTNFFQTKTQIKRERKVDCFHFSWGSHRDGKLGIPNLKEDVLTPVCLNEMFPPLKKEPIAQIAAGSDHSCILTRTYQFFVFLFFFVLISERENEKLKNEMSQRYSLCLIFFRIRKSLCLGFWTTRSARNRNSFRCNNSTTSFS